MRGYKALGEPASQVYPRSRRRRGGTQSLSSAAGLVVTIAVLVALLLAIALVTIAVLAAGVAVVVGLNF